LSAVSKKLIPVSGDLSRMRWAMASSAWAPKVMAPMQIEDTAIALLPSRRFSIALTPVSPI
jgi:hypothetical protein